MMMRLSLPKRVIAPLLSTSSSSIVLMLPKIQILRANLSTPLSSRCLMRKRKPSLRKSISYSKKFRSSPPFLPRLRVINTLVSLRKLTSKCHKRMLLVPLKNCVFKMHPYASSWLNNNHEIQPILILEGKSFMKRTQSNRMKAKLKSWHRLRRLWVKMVVIHWQLSITIKLRLRSISNSW